MAKFLCPRCFEEQNVEDIQYICTNTNRQNPCSHSIDRIPMKFSAKQKEFKCEECGKPLATKLCPLCGFELPLGTGTTKNHPIAIIGAKESGKSNYVAVLINMLKNEVGKSFDSALIPCGDATIERYKRDFYNPLYLKRICAGATDAGDVDPLIYNMLFKKSGGLFRKPVNNAVNLTFFDTAGENLNSSAAMQTHNRYLCHASGIILLLDPLQLPVVRNELEGKINLPEENSDVNSILSRTMEIIRNGNHMEDVTKKIDIPIAVAFTKIDAIDSLLDPSSCLKNDSSHIRKGFFDMNDFNDANGEMQSLVEKWFGSELYQTLSMQFNDFAFFGLSALGSNPDTDKKIPKFRPLRVADPFLWILAKEKIIKSK